MKHLIIFLLLAGTSFAHPGGLDEKGGHVCKTNCEKYGLKMGEYHFHKEPETEPEPDASFGNTETDINAAETKPEPDTSFTDTKKTDIKPVEPKPQDNSLNNIFIGIIIILLCALIFFILFILFKIRRFAYYLKNKFLRGTHFKNVEKS